MGLMKRPPAGLGASGRALWRDIMTDYGLAPHERAILVQCCWCVDRLDAIETELAGASPVTEGSLCQGVVHPLLPSAPRLAPPSSLSMGSRDLNTPHLNPSHPLLSD